MGNIMPIHLQKTISRESEAQVYMYALCVLVREHLSGLSSLNLAGGEDLILQIHNGSRFN